MSPRPATPEDIPTLAVLHAASFDAPWSSSEIAALLAAEGGFGLMTPDGSGFLLARVVAGEAEILTVAVDPAARRAGSGRALVEAAVDLAAARGAGMLFLEVAVDNAAAIALYHRCGFARAGFRPRYYRRAEGPVDALVLRRDLTEPPPRPIL